MFPMKYVYLKKRIFEIESQEIINMDISISNPPYEYSYTIFDPC